MRAMRATFHEHESVSARRRPHCQYIDQHESVSGSVSATIQCPRPYTVSVTIQCHGPYIRCAGGWRIVCVCVCRGWRIKNFFFVRVSLNPLFQKPQSFLKPPKHGNMYAYRVEPEAQRPLDSASNGLWYNLFVSFG